MDPLQNRKNHFGEVGLVAALELWNVASKPENVGWRLMMEAVRRGPSFRPQLRFAIVVDSDLGSVLSFSGTGEPSHIA